MPDWWSGVKRRTGVVGQVGLDFECDIDITLMSASLFRDVVDAAGKRIGLGDFRPATKGPFGKFVVTKWKNLK